MHMMVTYLVPLGGIKVLGNAVWVGVAYFPDKSLTNMYDSMILVLQVGGYVGVKCPENSVG